MFKPLKSLSAVVVSAAILFSASSVAFAEQTKPDLTETVTLDTASEKDEQYFTVNTDWLKLSIMNKPFGDEFSFLSESSDNDRHFISYTTGNFNALGTVELSCSMNNGISVEYMISKSQEQKKNGETATDYLSILKAKSGQDIHIFSQYLYGTENPEIAYYAISRDKSGYEIYITAMFDGEHNTAESKEKAFELFGSLSWEIIEETPEAGEARLIETGALGTYSAAAKRISYDSGLAQFSLDIPEELSMTLADGQPEIIDDESTTWKLFYGQSDTLFIQSNLYKSKTGYAGEIERWKKYPLSEGDEFTIITTNDLDGIECSIVEYHLFINSGTCHDTLLGIYPIDEENWLSVSVNGTHSVIEKSHDSIVSMLSSFSRSVVNPDEPDEKQYVTETDALGKYSAPATRIVFDGEKAKFSVDSPCSMIAADNSETAEFEGLKRYVLMKSDGFPEGNLSIAIVDGEKYPEILKSETEKVTGEHSFTVKTDADGKEYYLADVVVDENGAFKTTIAAYPLDDNTFIEFACVYNNTGNEQFREDFIAMLGTFSRNSAKSDVEPENPSTGVPVNMAIFTAVCAAGVMIIAKRKK